VKFGTGRGILGEKVLNWARGPKWDLVPLQPQTKVVESPCFYGDYIFGPVVHIRKDLGPMYFWRHG